MQEVWDVLDVSYRNQNEEEARQAPNSLRQKKRSFGAYLAEFQRLRNLAKINDDKTLIAALQAGVSDEMRGRISQQQDIKKAFTFDEFTDLCKECQICLDLDKPMPQNPNTSSRKTINPMTSSHPSVLSNRFPSRPSYSSTSQHPPSGSNTSPAPPNGDPMVLDRASVSILGPDGRLTPQEWQRRFDLKLCVRCGKPGHRAATCPKSIRENAAINQVIAQASLEDEEEALDGLFDEDDQLKD